MTHMELNKILLGMAIAVVAYSLLPEIAYAVPSFGGGFESRMGNLQDKLINTIMPIMAILGLVWAGILAASGNESAKGKAFLVIIGSVIAFLSPHIISWLKGVLN